MLCDKISQVQNGQMLLMQPSNRIIEEEESPEQWPAETSDNLNGQMSFDIGMNLGSMFGQMRFSDHQTTYQEEVAVLDFSKGPQRDDLSPQSSISSNSLPLGTSHTSSLSQQQQFLEYNSWNVQDPTNIISASTEDYDRTRETDLYSQLEQNLNNAFGSSNINEMDCFQSNGNLWAGSGIGLGMDGMVGGPEIVKQWN
jgi:hypothetical protein